MERRLKQLTRAVGSHEMWRGPFVQIYILGFLFVLTYSPVLQDLVGVWLENPNYSHGFMIPVISAYFVWERRGQLQNVAVMPSNWGAMVLTAGIVAFLMGTLGAGAFVLRASMILVIAGIVLFLVGAEALKLLLFPLTFLILMIPLPDVIFTDITFPLQLIAARTATFCLQALAIPVLREGNLIFLAYTTLEVAEACSGIRSLVSLLAIGIVFAYFTQQRTWKRVLLVLSAIPIAIVANAFRVSATGMIAHYFGPSLADGFYHSFSGLVVFTLAFFLLLAVGQILSRCLREER